jgi:hypothetical protein
MVLTFYGLPRSQNDLAISLGLFEYEGAGIPTPRVTRLNSRQIEVTLHRGEVDDLLQALADGTPPIVEVQTGSLTHWQGEDTQHVVLLAATEDSNGVLYAVVNDPAFPEPITIRMDELLIAWTERDNRFVTIRRK